MTQRAASSAPRANTVRAPRIEGELGECTVVGTGGLSPLIAPFTESIEHVEPWLTLHGLRLVHAMNAE